MSLVCFCFFYTDCVPRYLHLITPSYPTRCASDLADTARAMPRFVKLNRFLRVAIVADQAWIRLASRLECAILPFISYRVFEPDQRADALAWVDPAKTQSGA